MSGSRVKRWQTTHPGECRLSVSTRKIRRGIAKHRNAIISCTLGLFVLFFSSYGYLYATGWRFSFTNFTYSQSPFSSLHVSTRGPWLSDVADNVLPTMWAAFHPLNITTWFSSSGIGFAQGMDVYLFPLNWLYALPFDVAQPLVSIVKVAIAFTAMFFFIRQIGYTWRGAFIGGASYSLCSVMVMWNGWPHSSVTMLAPLLFLILDKLLTKLTVRRYIALSVVVYLMLVAGMPTYAAYFLYFSGAYMLFYGIRVYRKTLRRLLSYSGWFLVSVVAGGLLSLPYTLQLLDSVGSNGYADTRKSYAASTLSLSQLKTLLFPYLPTSMSIHLNEGTLFVGVLAIVTLPLTVMHFRRKPRVGFFAVSAAVLSLLIFTHVLDGAYQLLPMINSSLKFRVLVLLEFSLSVLLGANADDLLTCKFSDFRDKIRFGIAAFFGIIGYIVVLFRVFPLIHASDSEIQMHIWIGCAVVCTYALVVAARIITNASWCINGCVVVLFCVVGLDMGYFSYHYWPAIDSGSTSIPAKTSTISQLQNGTKDREKIVNVGSWDLFPMTNVFYGLRNINGHGFVYTNTDVSSYFTSINSDAFSASPTRPTFSDIDSGGENLLKYLGVKYVTGSSSSFGSPNTSTAEKVPFGPLKNGMSFTQSFTATANGLHSIGLYVGLTAHARTQGTLTVSVRDVDSGTIVASSARHLKDITDNSEVLFSFNSLKNSRGREYEVIVRVNDPTGEGVALYTTTTDSYAGEPGDDLSPASGDLAMNCLYSDVTVNNDGLAVKRFNSYSRQIQLTDDVEIRDSDQSVLDAMRKSFSQKTVYLSTESGSPQASSLANQTKLQSDEKVTNISESSNGNMTFSVTVDRTRMVVVNEYNDGNWTAYIDGKQTSIYKGNYLFRAIEVPEGTHEIKLVYRPKNLYRTLAFSAFIGGVMIAVIVFFPESRHLCSHRSASRGGSR